MQTKISMKLYFPSTLVITGEVITMEMGPGSQKAKNTIGPDLRSFLGMRLSTLNSNTIYLESSKLHTTEWWREH